MDAPSTSTGALTAVILGMAAAVTALLIAQFFPTIIPARAAAIKL